MGGGAGSCGQACTANPKCQSFTMCNGGQCFLKDAPQDGNGAMKDNQYCSSYFWSNQYFPATPSLLQPSTANQLEFYVYRAQSPGNFYPPANTNTASIGGVMWYLQNEVVKTCDGAGFLAEGGKPGDRKFEITTIRRIKITLKPT